MYVLCLAPVTTCKPALDKEMHAYKWNALNDANLAKYGVLKIYKSVGIYLVGEVVVT